MLKIPKGFEKFEKVLQKEDLKMMLGYAYSGINIPIDYRQESPSLAAIALFNEEYVIYERFIKLMHKHVGKYGASIIMKMLIENDMGIYKVSEMWADRNIKISHNFIKSLTNCDEKYIRYFLETDKFLRLSKHSLRDPFVITWIKKYAPRLIEVGFEYPKVVTLFIKIYKETEEEMFLPDEVKDIFFL